MRKSYYVYILSSLSRTLYIGITNNIRRRVWEHTEGITEGFTKRYNICHLVYYEEYNDVHEAIAREKQLKSWNRNKKCALIERSNPGWHELSLA
ncbi:MAG: GIY-YIG nuclease family protein [Candidatus Uhrbacteria bacterium]|nr:GIY-YIG nuclease family protein [Candidatus Uhrbacteria bacterium]